MNKMVINMLSAATSVEGQGVGSAYMELIRLLKEYGKDDFEIRINAGLRGCDLVHAHTVGLVNLVKMKLFRKPTIAYVHFLPTTLDQTIKLPGPIFKIFKKYVAYFYGSADHLVVVNPEFKKDMVQQGLDAKKITYIPNFVSKKQFYRMDSAEIAALRKQHGMDMDEFVVMGCGQVQTKKGVDDFVKVAEMLPDVRFIWVGGFSFGAITDGYERLKKIVEDPPKNVTFTGIVPRAEMNDWFNMADMLFMPSYNELFPMAILEAASTETPMLLRDLDLYKGILFEKYAIGTSVTEFAEQITALKDRPERYAAQVENAKYISNYYSEDNVYQLWKTFYTRVAEGLPVDN